MIRTMSRHILFAFGVVAFSAQAGELDPPGPPGSTMVTLEEIEASIPPPPDTCTDNTNNRFVDCGDGTVKDKQTGLFWLKTASCLGETWSAANIQAANLAHGQCGLTDGSQPGDWRLPTLSCPSGATCGLVDASGEFTSIFAPTCPAPFILDAAGTGCWTGDPQLDVFDGVLSQGYWSSTSRVDPNFAWNAGLNLGAVRDDAGKVGNLRAWPVRSGQ